MSLESQLTRLAGALSVRCPDLAPMAEECAKMAHGEDKLMNREEACKWLSISRDTLTKRTLAGDIPGMMIGGQWRYSKSQIMEQTSNG